MEIIDNRLPVHLTTTVLLPPPGLALPSPTPSSDVILVPACHEEPLDACLPEYFAGKSPISVLREECMKKGIEPTYELLASDGPVHQRLFTYRVSAGERSAVATGTSKKKARHACATLIVLEMFGNTVNSSVSSTSVLSVGNTATSSVSVDGQLNAQETSAGEAPSTVSVPAPPAYNPIGKLQEITQKRYIAPPSYELTDNGLKPHERIYTCVVHLGQLSTTGIARTKRLAKRTAAETLLRQLDAGGDGKLADISPVDRSVSCVVPLRSSYSIMARDGLRSTTDILSDGLVLNSDQPAAGPTSPLLCPVVSCVETLQNIAETKKFEVTYVDIPEPSSSGHYQCLIQLSTMPVITCRGVGASKDEARSSAALNSLRCIFAITKGACQ